MSQESNELSWMDWFKHLSVATVASLVICLVLDSGARDWMLKLLTTDFCKELAKGTLSNFFAGLFLIMVTVWFVDTRKERREELRRCADSMERSGRLVLKSAGRCYSIKNEENNNDRIQEIIDEFSNEVEGTFDEYVNAKIIQHLNDLYELKFDDKTTRAEAIEAISEKMMKIGGQLIKQSTEIRTEAGKLWPRSKSHIETSKGDEILNMNVKIDDFDLKAFVDKLAKEIS